MPLNERKVIIESNLCTGNANRGEFIDYRSQGVLARCQTYDEAPLVGSRHHYHNHHFVDGGSRVLRARHCQSRGAASGRMRGLPTRGPDVSATTRSYDASRWGLRYDPPRPFLPRVLLVVRTV